MFGLHIDGGGCVVQYQYGGAHCQGSGEGDALLLAAGQSDTAFADQGVVAHGHFSDESICVSCGGESVYIFYSHIGLAVGDVAFDRVGEEEHVLHGVGDVGAYIVERVVVEGFVVYINLAVAAV